MRKWITLGLSLMFAFSVDAQEGEVRKLWDFTQGFSETTLTNLAKDAASADGYWVDHADKGYYESKKWASSGEIKCKVNGEDWIIPETQGLKFGATSAEHLNIQFESENYGPHMWINGRTSQDNIVIPQVPAGDSITIVYSSHSTSEKRGFKVSTDGVTAKDGETKEFKTEGRDTVVLINNNSDDTDVKLTATSGMHYHYICVGEIPHGEVDNSVKVAYLFDSGYDNYNGETDIILNSVLNGLLPLRIADLKVTPIDAAGDISGVTRDSLEYYDVVVVGDAIRTDNAIVPVIKEAIAYVPMLNLSPALYEAWGYGKAVQTTTNVLDIPQSARDNALFTPSSESTPSYIDENGQFVMFDAGNVTGYTAEPGTYFAKDDTLAVAGGVNAIHMHNASRNAYMLLPYTLNTAALSPAEANFADIIPNAVVMLNSTKRNVVKTATPKINETYHQLYTTVELTSATKNTKIYYTIDGTEPTVNSTLYTEPFNIDAAGVTVKAVGLGDGYNLSDVAEGEIAIHELVKSPAIELSEESGKTTVTVVPAEDGDVVMYNFANSSDSVRSSIYTEPIVLTKHATITVFAIAKGEYLQSESVSQEIRVKDEAVRMDVLAHMDANKMDWNPGDKSPYYFIDRGGYPFYTDEIIKTDIYKDQNGEDSIVNTYKEANQLSVYNPQNGWEFKTYGQVGLWQSNNVAHNVGDFSGYNPETAMDDDEEITNSCVSFASVNNMNGDGVTDPGSACIQSTVAFQAPFDVVTYISGHNSKVKLYVSSDTTDVNSWKEVGDLYSGSISGKEDKESKRIWKKTILPYNGTDQVFIKVASGGNDANIFDIFVKYEGELSKAYKDKVAGIENVNTGKEAAGEVVRTMVYSINGTLLDKAAKGINIVKEVYANGAVKTKKVVIK